VCGRGECSQEDCHQDGREGLVTFLGRAVGQSPLAEGLTDRLSGQRRPRVSEKGEETKMSAV
jgi:hypothetical protein